MPISGLSVDAKHKKCICNNVIRFFRSRLLVLLALVSVSISVHAVVNSNQIMQEAQQAYNQGQYLDAFELLKPLESKKAGIVEFDYLYGRVAIEAGELNTAIAALSRVLALDPGFPGARLELARTYYSKGVKENSRGSFEQAKAEFETVLDQNPPRHIEKSIDRYLLLIDKYLEVRHLNMNMFAEVSGGYNSNINSGTDNDQFYFYDRYTANYKLVDLAPETKRTESSFVSGQIGLQIILPLFTKNFDLFLGGTARSFTYDKVRNFDTQVYSGQFGAHHYGNSNTKTISMNFKAIEVNEEKYGDEFYIDLEWAQKIDEDNMLDFRFVAGDSNFESDRWPMSVNGFRTGAEWTHVVDSKDKHSYQILLIAGRDDYQQCQTDCTAPYRRGVIGARFSASRNIFGSSRIYSSLYIEGSDYDEEFFGKKRRDRHYEIFLGLNMPVTKNWQIRPEIHWTYNESNVNLFEYQRFVGSLNMRVGF
ncbi:MAG: tetratricopeptide repeat protein [Gammaproteobacteria bacterium]|nr:tetratricopeptide repeat protein [Gammaproteobacteria bacterium]MDH5777083.1 tetratricopeptide repeat protein [Gammaproteobacteria bacterium]